MLASCPGWALPPSTAELHSALVWGCLVSITGSRVRIISKYYFSLFITSKNGLFCYYYTFNNSNGLINPLNTNLQDDTKITANHVGGTTINDARGLGVARMRRDVVKNLSWELWNTP